MFLSNTRAAFADVVSDLRRLTFGCGIVANSFPIVYLIYAIFAPAGILALNIALLIPSAAYLAFYIAVHGRTDKQSKRALRTARHTICWYKIIFRLFNAVIMIYGIYAASTHVTVWSIVLAAFMVISLAIQLILELAVMYTEYQFERIAEGMRKDFEVVTKPVNAVKGFIGKLAGDGTDEDAVSSSGSTDESRRRFSFFAGK